MTALGVCAMDSRDDEQDDQRSRELLVVDLCRKWAGRDGRRRRMVRIFQLRKLGWTEREIAEDLERTPRTVRRIVAEVQAGLRRYYGRPTGEHVDDLVGVG